MPTANAENNFVSRAEGKLEGAVRAFRYDFRDKTVLDIGSSTGGFTELALKLGAKRVFAIEKGSRQMKAPLRFDSRISLHEKTDFFDVVLCGDAAPIREPAVLPNSSSVTRGVEMPSGISTPAALRLYSSELDKNAGSLVQQRQNVCVPVVDTIVADVSFVSLTRILKHARMFADQRTDFLVMLKPQFEARPQQLWKGVVKNEKMRREIIKGFEIWLKQNGFIVLGKRDNEVFGKNGNQERFYHLKIAK